MRIESRHGWVEIVERTLDNRFVVLGHPGTFRAELIACTSDLCNGTVQPARESCTIPLTTSHGWQHPVREDGRTLTNVNAWHRHIDTHCHGWHWPTVEAFARQVLKTYGAKPAFATKTIGSPRPTDPRHLIPINQE